MQILIFRDRPLWLHLQADLHHLIMSRNSAACKFVINWHQLSSRWNHHMLGSTYISSLNITIEPHIESDSRALRFPSNQALKNSAIFVNDEKSSRTKNDFVLHLTCTFHHKYIWAFCVCVCGIMCVYLTCSI